MSLASLDRAAKGEPFIIAKARKPLVKAVRARRRRTSVKYEADRFMLGIEMSEDFDTTFQDEIKICFYGQDATGETSAR